MGAVTSSTCSTMFTFNLLSIAFSLFFLAFNCEGTLKEDFCTDVSFWDVVKYTSTTAKCCDTVLREECKTKTERVCEDATEIKCNTVGWAECTTKIWPSQGKKCHVTYKDFPYRTARRRSTLCSITSRCLSARQSPRTTVSLTGTLMSTETRFGEARRNVSPSPGRSARLLRRPWTSPRRRPTATLLPPSSGPTSSRGPLK